MPDLKNPYQWNVVNPDLCYGRDELVEAMLVGLRRKQPKLSYGLAGGRRMGKTTVMRRLEAKIKSELQRFRELMAILIVPIYINGLTLPYPLTRIDIWNMILEQLAIALTDYSPKLRDVDGFDSFTRIVKSVATQVEEDKKFLRIIVLFDEIEPITVHDWANTFWGQWHSLLSNSEGALKQTFAAVFSGAREITQLRINITSPLANILEWPSLRTLDYDCACRLMKEPSNVDWEPGFLKTTYSETGGHPMLLQYLMQGVCTGIEEHAEQSLVRTVTKFGREQSWQFSQWWDKFCTPLAQRVYRRLPADGTHMPISELSSQFGGIDVEEALEVLLHLGIVQTSNDSSVICYSGEMFRRWYKNNGVLAEAAMHDPIIYEHLASINQEAGNRYLSAWQFYKANSPNYSGVAAEIRETLTVLLDTLAPVSEVTRQPGFRYEPGVTYVTRRQRVLYAIKDRSESQLRSYLKSDYELLDTECELLVRIAISAYQGISTLVHEPSTQQRAYRILKQCESVLAQLLDAI